MIALLNFKESKEIARSMNIQPYRTPSQWWSPKLTPWLVRLCKPLRRRILRRTQRIMDVEMRGPEHLQQAIDDGCGVIITPNHSSHTDPPILYEIAPKVGTCLYFMAAWQVFDRMNWLRQELFRRHGCFSVDREGADMRAFRQAVEILQSSPHPLVIFPEGEVYHVNETVTPFMDGPAAIAITAQKRADRPIVFVPCGMKFQYVKDPTEELVELMGRLEQQILWRPRPDLPLADRIYRFAQGILGVKELEYLGRVQEGPLPERVKTLAESVLTGIEQRYEVKKNDGEKLPERVKACRREVIKLLEDEDTQKRQQAMIDLDDLFMVIQLFSYPGDYVAAKPTIERMAETLDKFEEDILRVPTATIRGARKVTVAFGEPIPVELASDKKQSVLTLTAKLETAVQSLLDSMPSMP
jgi:1-acyl-sn-glycerol-3-phosphate acyltransferase